jgi:integrase
MVGPWIVDRAVDKVRQVDELHFHSLRHHVATLLIDSGCDVKTVQARWDTARPRRRSMSTGTVGRTQTRPPALQSVV